MSTKREWRVLRGIEYNGKRAEVNDKVDDLPDELVEDLVQRGAIVEIAHSEDTPEPTTPATPTVESGYRDMNVDDLADLADSRGLEVTGTGANGNVVKEDLVRALEASDPGVA